MIMKGYIQIVEKLRYVGFRILTAFSIYSSAIENCPKKLQLSCLHIAHQFT